MASAASDAADELPSGSCQEEARFSSATQVLLRHPATDAQEASNEQEDVSRASEQGTEQPDIEDEKAEGEKETEEEELRKEEPANDALGEDWSPAEATSSPQAAAVAEEIPAADMPPADGQNPLAPSIPAEEALSAPEDAQQDVTALEPAPANEHEASALDMPAEESATPQEASAADPEPAEVTAAGAPAEPAEGCMRGQWPPIITEASGQHLGTVRPKGAAGEPQASASGPDEEKPNSEVPARDLTPEEQERVAYYRKKILEVYEEYNPAKIEEVPNIMVKFRGKEQALYQAVCKKYMGQLQADDASSSPPNRAPAAESPSTAAAEDPAGGGAWGMSWLNKSGGLGALAGAGGSLKDSFATGSLGASLAGAGGSLKESLGAAGSLSAGTFGVSLTASSDGLLQRMKGAAQELKGAAEGFRENVERSFDEAIRSEEDASALDIVKKVAEKSADRVDVIDEEEPEEPPMTEVLPQTEELDEDEHLEDAAEAPASNTASEESGRDVASAPGAAPPPALAPASPQSTGAQEDANEDHMAQLRKELDQVPSLKKDLERSHHKQQELFKQYKLVRSDNEELKRQVASLKSEKQSLTNEGIQMSKRVGSVEERMKEVIADCRRAEAKASELDRAKKSLETSAAKLSGRAATAEALADEQRGELRRISGELERARSQLQGEQSKAAEEQQARDRRVSEHDARTKHIEDQLEAAARERTELVATNQALASDLQQANAALDAAEDRLEQQQARATKALEQQKKKLEAIELEFANQSLPYTRQIAELERRLVKQEQQMGEREAAAQRSMEQAEEREEAARREVQARADRESVERREEEERRAAASAEATELRRQALEAQAARETAEKEIERAGRDRQTAEAQVKLEASQRRSLEQRVAELTERVGDLTRQLKQARITSNSGTGDGSWSAGTHPSSATGFGASPAAAGTGQSAGHPPRELEEDARRLRMEIQALTRQRDVLEQEAGRLQNHVDGLRAAGGGRGKGSGRVASAPLEQKFEAALQMIGRLQEELEACTAERNELKARIGNG